MQQKLFENKTQQDALKEILSLSCLPEVAYELGLKLNLPYWIVLSEILAARIETDWEDSHNFFEHNGYTRFFKLVIFNNQFELKEVDGQVLLNKTLVWDAGEDFTYDEKTISKIKAALKKLIIDNKYQFEITKTKPK